MALKRVFIVSISLILQFLFYLIIYLFFIEHIGIIYLTYEIIAVLLVLFIIKKGNTYSYTLPWIIVLLLFPLVGTFLYVFLGRTKNKNKVLRNIMKHENDRIKYLSENKDLSIDINNGRISYLNNFCNYPLTTDNKLTYYKLGEEAFESMLFELRKAKKFIFLEFFIIKSGKMWNSILEILEEKANNGVLVRVMYDDLGCISSLNDSYATELLKKGIKCVAFNKLKPFAGVAMNNRDHRKILIIDGKIAFTGGINIADHYINISSKYGHWKDNALKIEGSAVFNYTVMFLSLWNSFVEEDNDYTKFKYNFDSKKYNGCVIPYGENPLCKETIGKDVYLNIINQAERYVYIMTPYLIIDNDLLNALILAVKRGVDVRIIIPGIPDKRIVYTLSLSYAEPLVLAGVNIYKYKPGFIHSKVFLADDNIATVGTINLDYRSLYLHFECGCYLENVDIIDEIKDDILKTIEKSHKIEKEEVAPKLLKGLWQAILRIFAPLM